jgi:uncharacterized protein (TIGR00730 family)
MGSRQRRLCVFCGSSSKVGSAYLEAAEELGKALVENDIELVYGGADAGTMGSLANSVIHHGGSVTGVIPKNINDRVGHLNLSEMIVVDSMHERKAKMYALADGFVTLPGGLGTMEELFEILTWQQLGYHAKPCGLINTRGYFDHLLRFIDHAVSEGFLQPAHRQLILVDTEPQPLLDSILRYKPELVDK